MIDIIDVRDGEDLVIQDSAVMKAANILSVQTGSLEYAPLFGIDIKYFVFSELRIQRESFKAYLIERLSMFHINTAEVIETIERFYSTISFSVSSSIDNQIDNVETEFVVPALATENGEFIVTEGGSQIGV